MDKKMTPLEMVAREMNGHSSLSPDEISSSMRRVLTHLRKRAADEIAHDDESTAACEAAQEYQAVSEMVNIFGSQLIAFEDLDAADGDRIKN